MFQHCNIDSPIGSGVTRTLDESPGQGSERYTYPRGIEPPRATP